MTLSLCRKRPRQRRREIEVIWTQDLGLWNRLTYGIIPTQSAAVSQLPYAQLALHLLSLSQNQIRASRKRESEMISSAAWERYANQVFPSSLPVCSQMAKGIFAFYGFTTGETYAVASSYSKSLHMPFINPNFPRNVSRIPYIKVNTIKRKPDVTGSPLSATTKILNLF